MSVDIVLGGSGLIGRELVRQLVSMERSVLNISKTGNAITVDPLETAVAIDLETVEGLKLFQFLLQSCDSGVETVYYLAGPSRVGMAAQLCPKNLENKFYFFEQILNGLIEFASSLVYASSGAVYDSSSIEEHDENSPLGPRSAYGFYKLRSEMFIMASALSRVSDYKIARIFSVLDTEARGFFLDDLVNSVLSGDATVILKGDGSQVRDYLPIQVISRALMFLGRNDVASGVYNICSGVPISLSDVCNLVLQSAPADIVIPDIYWDGAEDPLAYKRWWGKNDKIISAGFSGLDAIDPGKEISRVAAHHYLKQRDI